MTQAYPWPQIPRGKGRFIYALIDPRDDAIRYVGKKVGYLNSRLRAHLYEAAHTDHHTHKLAWLRQLLAEGVEPRVLVLIEASFDDRSADLNALERQWIAELRASGCDLTNATAGGEGMEGPSEETRRKMRAERRARPPIAAHVREAASAHLKSLWADPEWRAKQVARSSARRIRPKVERMTGEELRLFRIENARRMGAGNRGKTKSPQHRQKLAAATRAHYEKARAE